MIIFVATKKMKMKIEIKNFGPIDHLVFDMDKDLHLIYGQNAVGKSYATYCLYCLLKNMNIVLADFTAPESNNYYATETFNQFSKNIFDSFQKTNQKQVNITTKILGLFERILLEKIEKSLLNTFASISTLKNGFSNKDFELTVSFTEEDEVQTFVIYMKNNKLKMRFDIDLLPIRIIKNNDNYTLLVNKITRSKTNNIDQFIQDLGFWVFDLFKIICFDLLYSGTRNIHYLPASRSGLYQSLNSLSPIIAELSQQQHKLRKNTIELPTLTAQVAEYFRDLSTVNTNNINSKFTAIIEKLEQDILKGSINFDNENKKIYYTPKQTNIKLNLPQASSMVSELSPLLIYFKHILDSENGEPDIMFIEEPEAHLHPEIQVKLIEILAEISKMNIKIFITSHSNYMFNKLNNMLLNGDIDKDKIAVYHLIQGENGSYQNPNMIVTTDGIDDDNFVSVSEQLYTERMNIYEKD